MEKGARVGEMPERAPNFSRMRRAVGAWEEPRKKAGGSEISIALKSPMRGVRCAVLSRSAKFWVCHNARRRFRVASVAER